MLTTRKTLAALLLAAATITSSWAQSAREEITADPDKAGGVYYAYPEPEGATTPAPRGYKPFYMSHYGRHGSRYLLRNHEYDLVIEMLDRAHDNGELTASGEDVRSRMHLLYADTRGRAGELTQKGARQHMAIAGRMAENYPEIFGRKGARIECLSSVVPRCIMSMAAACDELKGRNPSLEITREASIMQMYRLHPYRKDFNPRLSERTLHILTSPDAEWRASLEEFGRRNIPVDRVAALLFKPGAETCRSGQFRHFVYYLMDNATHVQGLDSPKADLDGLFTAEELYEHWRYQNYSDYMRFGPSACNGSIVLPEALPMVKGIIDEADRAVHDGNRPAATLRFGHDTSLQAMCALLQIEGCCDVESDGEKIHERWVNYRITPMAANLQMVFYRKRGSDRVLVKFLLNEREAAIPVATDCFPYYEWSAVRAFCDRLPGQTPAASD